MNLPACTLEKRTCIGLRLGRIVGSWRDRSFISNSLLRHSLVYA